MHINLGNKQFAFNNISNLIEIKTEKRPKFNIQNELMFLTDRYNNFTNLIFLFFRCLLVSYY